MQSLNFYSLALMVTLSGFLSGCCCVQRPVGCGSCGLSSACDGAYTGLLHGELAGRIRNAMTGGCCSGCGEVYYDEQINEPPICDPCCGNGEFTGSSCGPCRPLFARLRDLWCAPCASGCGCDSCAADIYATESSQGGYCPNCVDGSAGNPSHHLQQRAHPAPTRAMPMETFDATDGMPTVPKAPLDSSLEPIPDPVSDSPSRMIPAHQPSTTSHSQRKSSPTIRVPAVPARYSQSRVVNQR